MITLGIDAHKRTRGGQPHSFHLHDVQFRVLAIGGNAPPPELRGWKDTVYLPGEGTAVKLLIRFGRHVDPTTAYMFHCHILRHEDNGPSRRRRLTDLPPAEPVIRSAHLCADLITGWQG